MMKKSYFQITYQLNISLLFMTLFTFVVSLIFQLINELINSIIFHFQLQSLTILVDILIKTSLVTKRISFIFLTTLLLSISYEIIMRISKDSLSNYFRSIKSTILFKQYIRQTESNTNSEIITEFNTSVEQSVIDITNDSISLCLSIPKSQQSKSKLKQIEYDIIDEISCQNSDYYFSTFIKNADCWWLVGTKR